MKIFVLYDAYTCEVIHAYRTMEEGIVAALQRLTFFKHTFVDIVHSDSYTVIEYYAHDTNDAYTLTIEETQFSM